MFTLFSVTTSKQCRGRGMVFLIVALFFVSSSTIAYAATSQGYVSLSGIPKLTQAANQNDLGGYLNTIYILIVGLGSLLAVIKIALAGVKYAMSDIVTNKSDAKDDIYGALLGLAILLLPYIILSTIYPNLVNLDFLKGTHTPSAQNSYQGGEYGVGQTKQTCKTGSIVLTTTQGGVSVVTCRETTSNSVSMGSVFTVQEPGNPANNIPAGQYDGTQGTVVGVSSSNGQPRFTVQFPDGSTYDVGCAGLNPTPQECP